MSLNLQSIFALFHEVLFVNLVGHQFSKFPQGSEKADIAWNRWCGFDLLKYAYGRRLCTIHQRNVYTHDKSLFMILRLTTPNVPLLCWLVPSPVNSTSALASALPARCTAHQTAHALSRAPSGLSIILDRSLHRLVVLRTVLLMLCYFWHWWPVCLSWPGGHYKV